MMKRILIFLGLVLCAVFANAQWIVQTEPLDLGVSPAVTNEFLFESGTIPSDIEFASPPAVAGLLSLPVIDPDADMLKALAFQLADSYEWPVPITEIMKIYNYVASQIRTDPYMGLIRSPERVLLDKAGSPLEQCYLFAELLLCFNSCHINFFYFLPNKFKGRFYNLNNLFLS